MTSPDRHSEARRLVLLVGAATVVAQALLVREAMAAMGGSELAWGAVMALWLGGVGAGARLGIASTSRRLVRALPLAVLLLTAVGVIVFRAAPALLGVASGELLTTTSAVWLWSAAVLPAAVAGGMGFPQLAARVGGNGGGRAYALESAGALAAGVLLSLGLLLVGTVAALSIGVGLIGAALVWSRRRWLAVAVLAAAAAAALPAAEKVARLGWHWSDHPGELRAWTETRLQRLEVSGTDPVAVYGDGRLLASYPDPYTVLPRAHLLMLLHPQPRRTLVVGGAADGSVEAMHRHPVDDLALVEEDPELLGLIPVWYGPRMATALADPRVRAIAVDPIRALRSGAEWDLIVLLDSDPSSLRRNRTRTLEFLRLCRRHLAPDGILVLRVAVTDTYVGGASGRLLSTLVATVDEVFPERALVPGEEVLVVAGREGAGITLDPAVLEERFRRREIPDARMAPELIPVLLDRDRAADLASRLDPEAPLNTVRRPRAVLLAGGLHEARGRPGLLHTVLLVERAGPPALAAAAAVAVLLVLAAGRVRRAAGLSTAAVIGFGSMSWWMLLMASWQVTRGAIYSEVGGLTALFMAGLAGGAASAARWTLPERRLPGLLVAMVAASAVVASPLPLRLPLLAVPLLLLVGGALTGASFPGLARLAHLHTQRGAGLAFAADESGAAVAALVVGIVAMPIAGLSATAAAVGFLQAAAIPAVVRAMRER